jgi:TPR repeat protein
MVASLWLALGAPSARGDEISDLANMAIDAALDDRAALYSLGVRFYAGEGVQQSRENAAVLWRKAAAAGSVGAKNNLGFLLFHGLGVAQDQQAAVALWRQAAESGHSESQLHLGHALFRGEGATQDHALGLAWVMYSYQSAGGHSDDPELGGGADVAKDAGEELDKLMGEASPAEVSRARQAVLALPVKPRSAQ